MQNKEVWSSIENRNRLASFSSILGIDDIKMKHQTVPRGAEIRPLREKEYSDFLLHTRPNTENVLGYLKSVIKRCDCFESFRPRINFHISMKKHTSPYFLKQERNELDQYAHETDQREKMQDPHEATVSDLRALSYLRDRSRDDASQEMAKEKGFPF